MVAGNGMVFEANAWREVAVNWEAKSLTKRNSSQQGGNSEGIGNDELSDISTSRASVVRSASRLKTILSERVGKLFQSRLATNFGN